MHEMAKPSFVNTTAFWQALHIVLKHLAHRDGKWGTPVNALCVTLPSPGNGSNEEQIDRAQWAVSLEPKRIGTSSQAEKNGAPSLGLGVEFDR